MFVGLTLSASAAYFSVTGLAAIFAGAVVSIIVMGSALEATKLVIASWLYRRWDRINTLMKSYLIIAIVVLMGITSLGIFGYLSQAYLEQDAPTAQLQNKIVLIEQRIDQENKNIERSTKALNQLDSQIDRMVEIGAVSRSNTLRNQQKEERELLKKSIDTSIAEIDKLNTELVPFKNQTAQVEAKVGPLKYFAKMIQGEDVDLDKAVQMVILLLIFVFDPLAVMTLIAANKEQMLRLKDAKNSDKKDIKNEQKPEENKQKDAIIEEKFHKDSEIIFETGIDTPQEEKEEQKRQIKEESVIESTTYTESPQERKNHLTNLKEKSKIIESKLVDSHEFIEEDRNESLYRFRHRKQQSENSQDSNSQLE